MIARFLRPAPLRVHLIAAAAMMLVGCASKRDIRDLQMELRNLATRQDSLLAQLRRDARAEARSTQDTLRTQGNQIVDLRGEIMQQLRQISETLTTLQALTGENQRTIASVRDQLVNLRRQQAVAPPQTQVRDSTALPGAARPPSSGPEELYNVAVSQLQRGANNTARTAFQQFLEQHPNHELAPNARFFLADLLYQDNDLDGALAAFREIPERSPTSERVPDALYRVAVILIELEQMDEAEATLERIINTYPETGAALLAREKLDAIR